MTGAADMLDAAMVPTREDRITAAAIRYVEATEHAKTVEDGWDALRIAESGIRSQEAQRAARLAYTVLLEAVGT